MAHWTVIANTQHDSLHFYIHKEDLEVFIIQEKCTWIILNMSDAVVFLQNSMLQEWVSFPIQVYNPDNTKTIHAVENRFYSVFYIHIMPRGNIKLLYMFLFKFFTGNMLLMWHCSVYRKVCSVKANRNGKLRTNVFL